MFLPSRLMIALIGLMLSIVGSCAGYWRGHSVGEDKILSRIATEQHHYYASTKKVTTEVVTVYKDRVHTVYVKGDTIIEKVPIYVTKEDDAGCTINAGFVRLWNSANQMSVPGPASTADGEASSVILSDVAAQHGAEAKLCHAKEEQLNSLQDWVEKQSRVH